jgi:4,5-dihydroxyphthalate decarboxylase
MSGLRMSFICSETDRTRPILDGSVKIEGVELASTRSHPSDTFWRMLKFDEFDISEMSI